MEICSKKLPLCPQRNSYSTQTGNRRMKILCTNPNQCHNSSDQAVFLRWLMVYNNFSHSAGQMVASKSLIAINIKCLTIQMIILMLKPQFTQKLYFRTYKNYKYLSSLESFHLLEPLNFLIYFFLKRVKTEQLSKLVFKLLLKNPKEKVMRNSKITLIA